MPCSRCIADPQPQNFGSPRRCAFDENGRFISANWRCATMDALAEHEIAEHGGDDESMQIIRVPVRWVTEIYFGGDGIDESESTHGFVVLNRYKHRGRCTSAMHVGDFWPAKAFTLELAEQILSGGKSRASEGGDPPQEIKS